MERMTKSLYFSLYLLFFVLCVPRFAFMEAWATDTMDDVSSGIVVKSVGTPYVVYDTGRDGCDWQDVPDTPARAFRDSSGQVHFFSTGSINRAMIGKDLDHLHHSCSIVYKARASNRPNDYDDNGWLVAFYARGNVVQALVHNEFHGSERPDFCPLGHGGKNCIEVSITAAQSEDGGNHFTRVSKNNGLVASLPFKFKPRQGQFYGLMNPSNIIQRGKFFYALVSDIDPYDVHMSGVCVIRTDNLDDPSSWRAWDGNGFSTKFVDPYKAIVDSPSFHVCAPLKKNAPFFSLGSVLWVPKRSSYILVTRRQKWDGPSIWVPGAYLSESKDLFHWSKPILLLSDEQAGNVDQLYPSIIDPDAKDQNFSTAGEHVILYTKISTPGLSYAGWKLVARKVELKF